MSYINIFNPDKPLKDKERDEALNRLFSSLNDAFLSPTLISIIVSNKELTRRIQPKTQLIRFTKKEVHLKISGTNIFNHFQIKPNSSAVFHESKPANSQAIMFLQTQLKSVEIKSEWIRKEKTAPNESLTHHDKLIHDLFSLNIKNQCHKNIDSRGSQQIENWISELSIILQRQYNIIKQKENEQMAFNQKQKHDKERRRTGNYYFKRDPSNTPPIHYNSDQLPDINESGKVS